MAETERRMFIGQKGSPSAVLRSKRGEPEEDARTRLTGKGWDMEAPHDFKSLEDGTGEFRVTDPKPPRKRKRKTTTTDDEGMLIEQGIEGNPAPVLGWLVPEKGDMIGVAPQEDKDNDTVIAEAKAKHGKKYEWSAGEKKPEAKKEEEKSEEKAEAPPKDEPKPDKSDKKSD